MNISLKWILCVSICIATGAVHAGDTPPKSISCQNALSVENNLRDAEVERNVSPGDRHSIEAIDPNDPYAYADYKGPKNAVLESLRATAVGTRNPRLANACKHGKIYSLQSVLSLYSVRIDERQNDQTLRPFIYGSDPMTYYTPRADYLRGVKPSGGVPLYDWIRAQYPEFIAAIEAWKKASANGTGELGVIEQWLQQHPDYRNGLLLFPHATLWNRVALQNELGPVRDGIKASKEYYIETIATLFNPQLAESSFTELRAMLMDLVGPRVASLSRENTIKTVAQWVLTQYPELRPLAAQTESALDKDSLTAQYGRTLGVIPVEWATGNMKQAMGSISQLESLPDVWQATTLPQIMAFIGGAAVPRIKHKKFELKDPDTGVRRSLRSGDKVALRFLAVPDPLGGSIIGMGTDGAQWVKGVVHAVIVDKEEIVGLELKLQTESNKVTKKTYVYWISDFEVEDSLILKSKAKTEQRIEFSSYTFPEDSGDISIQYAASNMQVPISVGDIINAAVQRSHERRLQYLHIVVTGFVRDGQGAVTGIRGYSDGDGQYLDKETILNNNAGKAAQTFLLSEINRAASFSSGSTARVYENQPRSPKREPFNHLSAWRVSPTTVAQMREDSGDFMLRIGSPAIDARRGERGEQAPLSIGDEVVLVMDAPETRLGYRSYRVLITAFVRDSEKIIGVQGIDFDGRLPSGGMWPFKQVLLDHSYLVSKPWFKERANAIPGAFEKRVPNNSAVRQEEEAEPTRNSEPVATAAWTDRPLSFEEWLRVNRLLEHQSLELDWAYWVLQVSPTLTEEEIGKKRKELALKFHPDLVRDSQSLVYINMAYNVIRGRR